MSRLIFTGSCWRHISHALRQADQGVPRPCMSLCSGLRLWRSCQSCPLPRAAVQREPRVLPGLRLNMLRVRLDAVSGILLAIDRGDMRRIEIEVGSADAKLFFVRIDPFPQ